MIPFNKPFMTGKEIAYIQQSVANGKISGDGLFTQKCHAFFENKYGFKKALLTSSCTDALEMAALLINTQPGDEIIAPAYTFVSTVNAFVLRGAKIVFTDCENDTPNIDVALLPSLITPKTKAIVVLHYAGIACNMDAIIEIANKHNLYVIEDAAHSIDSFYKEKPLGSIGHLAAFSFHETKNIISGEGGMLAINDETLIERAEIIREKGTNRSQFFRGQVNKYEWVDIGSSFLPSEITAAFLYAQLENITAIQNKRISLWNKYNEGFKQLAAEGKLALPVIPGYATQNGHMFYVLTDSIQQRDKLLEHLKQNQILAVFHYLPLHKSPFYAQKHDGRVLPNVEKFADLLIRLPLFYELTDEQQGSIIDSVYRFYA